MTAITLRAGSLIVLEGLDRTGKSTQRTYLSDLEWTDPKPVFTHMPSGFTRITEQIYELTERESLESPLARQLLHLACHAENMLPLATARTRGIFLDRWWWSTVAYGWHGGGLNAIGMREDTFFNIVDLIWHGQPADVVFLFMDPLENDKLNRSEVRAGYEILAEKFPDITVRVPLASLRDRSRFICSELRARGLLTD
jgi:dTMP kinase